jgi:hypothetical protein
MAALAAVMVDGLSAQAQTSSSITENQFNSQDSPLLFQWGLDSSINVFTNEHSTVATGAVMSYGVNSSVWDITINFNTGIETATIAATTDYLSPDYNWSVQSPIGLPGSDSFDQIMIAELNSSANGESMVTSDIKINGVSLDATLDDGGQPGFLGLDLTYDGPINSLSYVDTITSDSGFDPYNADNGPALLSEVQLVETPEPGTCTLASVGLFALIFIKRKLVHS